MNTYFKYSLWLFIAIASIGMIIYFIDNHSETTDQTEVYTCPMHPEIIENKPGSCPICGMNLVKKVTVERPLETDSIEELLKPTNNFIVGNYQTITAKDTTISSEINLPGMVVYDPNSTTNIAARSSGRIERIYIRYKFQKVNKGQKLFEIYSPELLTEQQNFIYLITNDAANDLIIKASKQKLILYGMSESQIHTLVSTKKVDPRISVYSPVSGIVVGTEKTSDRENLSMQDDNTANEVVNIREGNFIKKGETVFRVVKTDRVWAVFNISQGSSSLIKINQPITITSELDSNSVIDAKINFVETQFNSTDKTNRIRVHLDNITLKWPIGLRLQGRVKTNPLKGIWLPKQAMVSLGTKKIVFKKTSNGFKATAIETGIETTDFVQVINGLSSEDILAKNADYLMDSESFIKTE